jgi:hypothetical protein
MGHPCIDQQSVALSGSLKRGWPVFTSYVQAATAVMVVAEAHRRSWKATYKHTSTAESPTDCVHIATIIPQRVL